MGRSRLEQTVNALQVAGIRTARGHVAQPMPEPSSPVAAVTVREMTDTVSSVNVTVYTTAAQGGILCEDTALMVMEQLKKLNAACTMGSCSFNGRTGLFSVTVQAQYRENLTTAVLIDQVLQEHVVQISITNSAELYRVTNAETGTASTMGTDQGWHITLTELLPENTPPQQKSNALFDMIVRHPGGAEQYSDCRWERCTLERTPAGMKRTRVARTWAEKIVAAG